MSTAKIILSVIVVIAAVLLIAIVMFQSGKSSGLNGAIGGNSFDTYMGKNRSGSLDAKLARATKWIALVFVLAVLVLNLI